MAVQFISLTEGFHFILMENDEGWEWDGIGLFREYADGITYATEDAARNAAISRLLQILG